MDLSPHERTERGVHHLVTLQRAFAVELRRHDQSTEMSVIVGLHQHLRAGQAALDQSLHFERIHKVARFISDGGRPRILQDAFPLRRARTRYHAARLVTDSTSMPTEFDAPRALQRARTVLAIEADAVSTLIPRLGPQFVQACELLLSCQGRVVVSGMGKSGHIANKIAATLASTGTPAFFVHPGDAGHGDIGMITGHDVFLALSNSGETAELITLLPIIKRLDVALIALTGKPESTLGKAATVILNVSVPAEACSLNLAPTASTTATLAMGDALAVAVLEARGFTEEDFARSHPGGSLGRRLLLHVRDVMRTGRDLPTVSPAASLKEGLLEMSSKGLGMTTIVDATRRLIGIFTDGDLRRTLEHPLDVGSVAMQSVMTANPRCARAEMLAAEAVHLMEAYRITALPVVDDKGILIGAFNVHDLLRAGVM